MFYSITELHICLLWVAHLFAFYFYWLSFCFVLFFNHRRENREKRESQNGLAYINLANKADSDSDNTMTKHTLKHKPHKPTDRKSSQSADEVMGNAEKSSMSNQILCLVVSDTHTHAHAQIYFTYVRIWLSSASSAFVQSSLPAAWAKQTRTTGRLPGYDPGMHICLWLSFLVKSPTTATIYSLANLLCSVWISFVCSPWWYIRLGSCDHS